MLFSRQNIGQSKIVDEVYTVIARHGKIVPEDGVLMRETRYDAKTIIAALELLQSEGKVQFVSKAESEFSSLG